MVAEISPKRVMTDPARAVKIQTTMASWGEHSPSVARALSDLERECLAAIALALPASWVVTIEPPHGQIAITPVAERNRFHRCWVASGSQRRIFRDDARSASRI